VEYPRWFPLDNQRSAEVRYIHYEVDEEKKIHVTRVVAVVTVTLSVCDSETAADTAWV